MFLDNDNHLADHAVLNRRRFLGGSWGKQVSRTHSVHARMFPDADCAFMDASRRNAGCGMDGHVDMVHARSLLSSPSGGKGVGKGITRIPA